jgi:hypothetical protein
MEEFHQKLSGNYVFQLYWPSFHKNIVIIKELNEKQIHQLTENQHKSLESRFNRFATV